MRKGPYTELQTARTRYQRVHTADLIGGLVHRILPRALMNVSLRSLTVLTLMVTVAVMAAPSVAGALPVFADPGLESAVRAALGIPEPTPVTEADMLMLTSLTATSSGIQSLSGLEYATNLTTLDLKDNAISDLSPLAGLTNLTSLRVDGNQVSDLTPIAGLTQLRLLFLGATYYVNTPQEWRLGNNVTDLAPVSGLTNLQQIAFSNNQVSNLAPLAELPNLTYIAAGSNCISDVSPLAGMSQLWYLVLSRNQITDISPLSGLTSLTYLRLGFNLIEDISPVGGMPVLSNLNVASNRVTDISAIVSNAGIGSGDLVRIEDNYLDLTTGSEDRIGVDDLLARGVGLTYEPQNEGPPPTGAPVVIPEGASVTVTSGQVTVTFPSVSDRGTLTVTPYAPRHGGPANFRLLPNLYYDIHPTATFVGPATVTLRVPADYTGDLTKLKIFHWTDTGWETLDTTVDVGARTIAFQTDTFSDFGAGEPWVTGGSVSTPASSGWSVALIALLGLGSAVVVRRRHNEMS